MALTPMGIFGGSFDPVHNGHLRWALEVYQRLNIAPIKFIPARQQVLKADLHTDAKHRLQMLQIALQDMPMFEVDKRELTSSDPSYTINSLTSLRAEYPDIPLCLIIGSDSFAQFARWHRYTEILKLAHLIVIKRKNTPEHVSWYETLSVKVTQDAFALTAIQGGNIYFLDLPMLDISATAIREQMELGLSPKYLVPEPVLAYMQQHHLYTDRRA